MNEYLQKTFEEEIFQARGMLNFISNKLGITVDELGDQKANIEELKKRVASSMERRLKLFVEKGHGDLFYDIFQEVFEKFKKDNLECLERIRKNAKANSYDVIFGTCPEKPQIGITVDKQWLFNPLMSDGAALREGKPLLADEAIIVNDRLYLEIPAQGRVNVLTAGEDHLTYMQEFIARNSPQKDDAKHKQQQTQGLISQVRNKIKIGQDNKQTEMISSQLQATNSKVESTTTVTPEEFTSETPVPVSKTPARVSVSDTATLSNNMTTNNASLLPEIQWPNSAKSENSALEVIDKFNLSKQFFNNKLNEHPKNKKIITQFLGRQRGGIQNINIYFANFLSIQPKNKNGFSRGFKCEVQFMVK